MDIYTKLKYDVTSPEEAYEYCLDNGRTTDLEELILTSPKYSYWYAMIIIHDRWEEGEDIISTSSEYAYLYAKYVIGDRWGRGEDVIMNSDYSRRYRTWISTLN